MTKRTVRARAEKAAERVSRLKRGARSAVVAEASSGNVFADISVRNPEEALVRAKLMSEVMRILRYQKLTQVERLPIGSESTSQKSPPCSMGGCTFSRQRGCCGT